MIELTVQNYVVFSAIFICILYAVANNLNNKKKRKVPKRPKIRPIQLFKDQKGFSDTFIQEKFRIKPLP